jgi:hypothetical protein
VEKKKPLERVLGQLQTALAGAIERVLGGLGGKA